MLAGKVQSSALKWIWCHNVYFKVHIYLRPESKSQNLSLIHFLLSIKARTSPFNVLLTPLLLFFSSLVSIYKQETQQQTLKEGLIQIKSSSTSKPDPSELTLLLLPIFALSINFYRYGQNISTVKYIATLYYLLTVSKQTRME